MLPDYIANPDPSIYIHGKALVLDFETTNLEKGTALNPDNQIVLACWHDGTGLQYKWGNELQQQELVAACNKADFLVAHNAKFELQWLQRCGYDVGSRPVFCTMVGEWVLAGNRHWRLNLNACLERRGLGGKDALVDRLIKDGVCPSDIPRSLLLRYGKQDVVKTRLLWQEMMRSVQKHAPRLLNVIYTRCLVTPALADIEFNGLHLDKEKVEHEYYTTNEKYERVMEEINEIAGDINPRSPTQLAHFIYGELGFEEKTDRSGRPIRNKATKQFPEGLPKTDEATLLSLRATTKRQRRFLELKKEQAHLSSALDKNLSMFLGAVQENGGMIYGELNQGRTVTHRLASSGRRTQYALFDKPKGCQFQNLPRAYKKLFSPRRKGWLFGEADGSQLEFRVAGHVGNEDIIRREVRNSYDVHRFTASVINSVPEQAVTSEQRTLAKPHTFKPLYGGQSGTKGEKAYYKAFGEKYENLKDTQDDWCITVEANKVLETEWGFRFYWPTARYDRSGWLNVKTSVYNAPIQSFATADIIPIGLAYFWHRTRDAQLILVNTVHDSIEAEFPPEERELFEKTAVQSLTTDVYNYLDKVYDVQFSVPLGVGMLVGTHWGVPLEGEEEQSVEVEVPYGNSSRSSSQDQSK